jgi:simple sugar transport system substrate-binding protein
MPEPGDDYGWNMLGMISAKALAEHLRVPVFVAGGIGYVDHAAIMRELIDDGADFLIAHASGYAVAAQMVAKETGIPVTVVGLFEKGLIPHLSQALETHAEEGGYLAGVLAARMTETNILGLSLSADDENWIKMAGGFIAGARRVKPDVEILFALIAPVGYGDVAGGKRITSHLLAAGADVIFGMGNGSAWGMLSAVEDAKRAGYRVWFIDVIGDKRAFDVEGVILSSVWWDYAPSLKRAARAYLDGTFGLEIYRLRLADDTIKLLRTPHIPIDLWRELMKIRADIIDGLVEIPYLMTLAEVKAMIEQ